MSDTPLLAYVNESYERGLASFARMASELVARIAPYRTNLRHVRSELMLEPLVLSHFAHNAPVESLDQIAFGYTRCSERPRVISARSNGEGAICLPNFGYLLTAHPDQEFRLRWSRSTETAALYVGNEAVPFRLVQLIHAAGSRVEIGVYDYSYLANQAPHGSDRSTASRLACRHRRHIDVAMEIIGLVYPQYRWLMDTAVRRIVLFSDSTANSYASLAAFGAVFLNVLEATADEVYFIEDLVHQCGHVVFSALTFETERFLRVPPSHCLPKSMHAEPRTAYSALHGLFTEAVMNECFEFCLAQDIFRGRQRHELLGRFALIFRRFNHDLILLRDSGLYTPEGERLYELCRQVFERTCRKRADLLCGFDFSDQPYAFSYEVFDRHNTPPSRSRRANLRLAPERRRKPRKARVTSQCPM
jgi:HEXXH motif-containing protein